MWILNVCCFIHCVKLELWMIVWHYKSISVSLLHQFWNSESFRNERLLRTLKLMIMSVSIGWLHKALYKSHYSSIIVFLALWYWRSQPRTIQKAGQQLNWNMSPYNIIEPIQIIKGVFHDCWQRLSQQEINILGLNT